MPIFENSRMENDNLIQDSVLDLIGNTPMVKLPSVTASYPGKFFAKLEGMNPGHSSKDRIANYIIDQAEKNGVLKPGGTIIETTSGNTGFSLAMISLVKGYNCVLAVTSKSSVDKIEMLKTMGAEVHVCPANVPPEDARSYYEVAKRLHKERPGSVYINQYFNELNIEAHYYSTGPEIWKQTQGKITHLIAASGTGGTISGTGKYLKEKNPNIKILGVDAVGSVIKGYHETGAINPEDAKPYKIEGLGKNLIPSATDFTIIDHYERVSDEDAAIEARALLKSEGIFAGYTSGAVMQGMKQFANLGYFDENSVVVLIFPDHGSRYLSKVYSDQWMEDQQFSLKDKKTIEQ